MTVKELIEKLQKLPRQDQEILDYSTAEFHPEGISINFEIEEEAFDNRKNPFAYVMYATVKH